MSEAEKKELILAIESGKSTDWVYNGDDEQEIDTFDELEAIKEVEPLVEKYATSRVEAYKAALRREIEKRIAKLNEFIRIANLPDPSTITLNRIDTLEQVLELLDTISHERRNQKEN